MFVPATKIREFLWNVFTAHYLEMTKGRAYGDSESQEDREAACYTLHRVMRSLLLLLAPIIPHITDHIWRRLYGTGAVTIHKELFPKAGRPRAARRGHRGSHGVQRAGLEGKEGQGVALKEPIQVEVPEKLRPYLSDLTRMHHITGD